MRLLGFSIIALLAGSQTLSAQGPNDRQREYLNFIKAQAKELRAGEKPPATREEWDARRRDSAQAMEGRPS